MESKSIGLIPQAREFHSTHVASTGCGHKELQQKGLVTGLKIQYRLFLKLMDRTMVLRTTSQPGGYLGYSARRSIHLDSTTFIDRLRHNRLNCRYLPVLVKKFSLVSFRSVNLSNLL